MEDLFGLFGVWWLWAIPAFMLLVYVHLIDALKASISDFRLYSYRDLFSWLAKGVVAGVHFVLTAIAVGWALSRTNPEMFVFAMSWLNGMSLHGQSILAGLVAMLVVYITGINLPVWRYAREVDSSHPWRTWQELTLFLGDDSWLKKLAWRYKI